MCNFSQYLSEQERECLRIGNVHADGSFLRSQWHWHAATVRTMRAAHEAVCPMCKGER